MGSGRTGSTTPDLFSRLSGQEPSSPSVSRSSSPQPGTEANAKASGPWHVLPGDLPDAMKELEDRELDRLLAVVLAEQERRGRKSPERVKRGATALVPAG
jgi:hypothetical protein